MAPPKELCLKCLRLGTPAFLDLNCHIKPTHEQIDKGCIAGMSVAFATKGIAKLLVGNDLQMATSSNTKPQ